MCLNVHDLAIRMKMTVEKLKKIKDKGKKRRAGSPLKGGEGARSAR
jgi:hypothetical protein